MDAAQASRRRFLVAVIAGCGAAATGLDALFLRDNAAWAAAAAADPSRRAKSLTRLARLLYPHRSLPDAVYAELLDDVFSAAANDARLARALDEMSVALDAGPGAGFSALDAASQLERVSALSDGTAFAQIRAQVRNRLYSHPALWEAIGYPGPSLPYGGYLERGFDDIDWLPEDP